MKWVFLSPHPDDIALSCGGLVWELAQSGETAGVWTVCAGDPPPGELSGFAKELHERWETGVQAAAERRGEDAAACRAMGAEYHPMDLPDCVYRRGPDGAWLYPTVMDIFGSLHPGEAELAERIASELEVGLEDGSQVVCPLALGNHVDHQLVRQAAERLGRPTWYYADYPYVLQAPEQLQAATGSGWSAQIFRVSPAGLEAWGRSVAAHASQISTFWPDLEAMQKALREYWQPWQGVQLWRRTRG